VNGCKNVGQSEAPAYTQTAVSSSGDDEPKSGFRVEKQGIPEPHPGGSVWIIDDLPVM
jgi:hypothetical protein